MESTELRHLLQEWRDSNNQLAESQRQIAESLQRIERMWDGQFQTRSKLIGKSMHWLPMIGPYLIMIPFLIVVLWRV